jgi:hypothetical protein
MSRDPVTTARCATESRLRHALRHVAEKRGAAAAGVTRADPDKLAEQICLYRSAAQIGISETANRADHRNATTR